MSEETFEYNGKTYHAKPDLDTLMEEAGMSKRHINGYKKKLAKGGYESTASLLNITKTELQDIKLSEMATKQLYNHIQRVKRLGGFLKDYDKIKERESDFFYLSTGSTMMDEMMTYNDGRMGLRSKTMIELYGPASSGKTQICMSAAVQCLRPRENGGQERGIVYIDSEGAFMGSRFQALCKYWGVDEEFMKENIFYSRVTTFDEVESAIDELVDLTQKRDIGLIVVDSIMDPLKAQYLVGGKNLNQLPQRQQHLQQVLGSLKQLAENNNAVALYTNHVRSEIGSYGDQIGAQGGHVMAHASDIRIYVKQAPKTDVRKWFKHDDYRELGLRAGRARITDCGFLPNTEGYFAFGPFGISDPRMIKKVVDQAKQVKEDGYISINALDEKVEPIFADGLTREERIAKIQEDLYGESSV